MKRTSSVLVAIGIAIPLLVASVVLYVILTIPPTPEPETLPSQILEPPLPAYREAVEEGRSIARQLVAEEKLPGLSLAVAVDGEIAWAEGFRWADMEKETPVTPETLFRIGVVTQCLTAAAVGVLTERARLDLDAPVQEYVPSFPAKKWPISTRQLMSHTAGIRHHGGEGGIFRGGSCADDGERLALFQGDSLISRPGTQLRYTTFGWLLVGAVVAAVAHESYEDFLQREVLAPLAMQNTFPEPTGQTVAGSAHFYYPRLMLNPRYGLQDAPPVQLSCWLPAVGYLSTPSDLVRLGSAMMSDALLEAATIEQMWTPARLASGETTKQALGWTVQNLPLGEEARTVQVVGQGLGEAVLRGTLGVETAGGQVSGGTALLLCVPEHRIAIALATNVSGAENVSVLATRLVDVFVRLRQGH